MTKKIACPACDGHGFHARHNENSVWSEVCDRCNGSGEVEIPMTNGDRIRAMTDAELAAWMHSGISTDPCDYCECNNGYCDGLPCRGKTDAETIIGWLRQPAGGADDAAT